MPKIVEKEHSVEGYNRNIITYEANMDITNDEIKKFCDVKSRQMAEDGISGELRIMCDYNIGRHIGRHIGGSSEIGDPVNMYDPTKDGYYSDSDISNFIGIARVFRITWGSYMYYDDDISSEYGNSSDDDDS